MTARKTVKKIDPAKAKELLKKAAPSFKKFDELNEAERERWQREIDMLETRVETESVDIELSSGHKIAIRTCLTDGEIKRLVELEEKTHSEKNPQKALEYTCESIALITANPIITKEWLMKNRDRYSPSDMLSVFLGYMEVRVNEQKERMKQLQSAALFRTVAAGAELR